MHEAVAVGGFGGEIAASVGEHCFQALKGPIRRLGAPRVPVSYAPVLENRVRVTAEAVATAVREMLAS